MAEQQKRNPKHVIGQAIGHWTGLITLTAITSAISLTTAPMLLDKDVNEADNIGSTISETLFAESQASIDELQDMRAHIEMEESKTSVGGSQADLATLKDAFADKALETYIDIYVKGATSEGAGLSEVQFDKLRTDFAENVVSPVQLGFKKNVEAGMLDETLATLDIATDSDTDKFQTAKALDNQLADYANTDTSFWAGIGGSFLGFFAFLLICIRAEEWRLEEPKYKKVQNKPKKPGKYGQH